MPERECEGSDAIAEQLTKKEGKADGQQITKPTDGNGNKPRTSVMLQIYRTGSDSPPSTNEREKKGCTRKQGKYSASRAEGGDDATSGNIKTGKRAVTVCEALKVTS